MGCVCVCGGGGGGGGGLRGETVGCAVWACAVWCRHVVNVLPLFVEPPHEVAGRPHPLPRLFPSSFPSRQVYLRQGKLLLAVQAAKKAQQLSGAADPSVHGMVARLADAVLAAGEGEAAGVPPVVLEVAREEAAALLGAGELSSSAVAAFRGQWAAAHAGSGVAAAAAALEVAPPEGRAAAAQQLAAVGPAGASHAECTAALSLLEREGLAEAAAAWRQQCAAVFRWSPLFGGADCAAVAAPWEADAAGTATEDAAANGLADKAAALAIS